jgi:hypothetical protein
MTRPTSDIVVRLAATDRVIALFLATDRKDWTAVEDCFTPDVLFDMSSVTGRAAETMRRAEIAAGWKSGLAAVEHLHHQAGNFVVSGEGDRVEVFCYGIAYHYRARRDGRNTRVFVGSYDFTVVREPDAWRISAMRFALKFVDGNAALEAAEP